jgi:hypothetical protein
MANRRTPVLNVAMSYNQKELIEGQKMGRRYVYTDKF